MPGVERLSVDQAVREAERAAKLAIPCIALFPYTDPALRDAAGSEALNDNNLVCRAIRAIKKEVPDIGILCDVALDPFTSHGHDGLLRDDGVIMNDETVAVLVQQALVQAQAGCDIIAPSDMMDGRVGAIRKALDRDESSPTCRSWPMPRNTLPPSTVRSATRSARRRRCMATSAPIRWIPAIPTRPCAKSRSTSRKAPT